MFATNSQRMTRASSHWPWSFPSIFFIFKLHPTSEEVFLKQRLVGIDFNAVRVEINGAHLSFESAQRRTSENGNIFFNRRGSLSCSCSSSVYRSETWSAEIRYSCAWVRNVERRRTSRLRPRRRQEPSIYRSFCTSVNQGEYISSGDTWDREDLVYVSVKPRGGTYCRSLSPCSRRSITFACSLILREVTFARVHTQTNIRCNG